jgi:parvulin-like peptidyl-prolyl isomerase
VRKAGRFSKAVVVLWFGAGVVAGLVGGLMLSRLLRGHRPAVDNPTIVATVNGENLPMSDFLGQLKLTAGARTLRALIEHHLIAQQARQKGIRLSEQEEKALADLLDGGPADAERRVAADRTFRSQVLLRRLLLENVDEAQVREVYDLYAKQLRLYETFVIVLNTSAELPDVLGNLEEGSSFPDMAKTYSTVSSKQNGGRLGLLTLSQIEERFGAPTRLAVAGLRKGNQVLPTFDGPQGVTVVKIGEIRSSYAQLRREAEDVLVRSKTPEFFYNLLSAAQISSPLIDKPIQVIDPLPATEPRVESPTN